MSMWASHPLPKLHLPLVNLLLLHLHLLQLFFSFAGTKLTLPKHPLVPCTYMAVSLLSGHCLHLGRVKRGGRQQCRALLGQNLSQLQAQLREGDAGALLLTWI